MRLGSQRDWIEVRLHPVMQRSSRSNKSSRNSLSSRRLVAPMLGLLTWMWTVLLQMTPRSKLVNLLQMSGASARAPPELSEIPRSLDESLRSWHDVLAKWRQTFLSQNHIYPCAPLRAAPNAMMDEWRNYFESAPRANVSWWSQCVDGRSGWG